MNIILTVIYTLAMIGWLILLNNVIRNLIIIIKRRIDERNKEDNQISH